MCLVVKKADGKAGFLFLSRTQQKDTKKVRECSVLIIFVCFVVKKADGKAGFLFLSRTQQKDTKKCGNVLCS
ncbi:MAG: hypothetical protein B6245_17815 [Desulfobacteraceae bacterium 4572_88]|nr:MAG: hypothetical protein B6245_17815 [Desulfobacteraceae bacterium 4572_88]